MTTFRRLALALCALSLSLSVVPAALAAPARKAAARTVAAKSAGSALGPSATVEASNVNLRKSLARFYAAKGPAREKARSEARASVGALLDFDAFAKATMGKHWEGLSAKERQSYAAAMKGAMEANYLARMQAGSIDVEKVKSEIVGEEKRGEQTVVKTKIHNGNDAVSVDYVMQQTPTGYRAVDVFTEGVSLVETYRDQINTLLPKKGLTGVIEAFERVRKRAEKQQDEGAEKSASESPAPPAQPAAK